jgi:NDP-sugar pyrophosphorylase family protein
VIYKKSWKYILTKDGCSYWSNCNFYCLKAVRNFSDITKDSRGGFVCGYHNLSQKGNCWIYDKALVIDDAIVYENARVYNYATIKGNSRVFGDSQVSNVAVVMDNAQVSGKSIISKSEVVKNNTVVCWK